jgi:hypothetical protein
MWNLWRFKAPQAYFRQGNLQTLEDFVRRHFMVGNEELAFEKSRLYFATTA